MQLELVEGKSTRSVQLSMAGDRLILEGVKDEGPLEVSPDEAASIALPSFIRSQPHLVIPTEDSTYRFQISKPDAEELRVFVERLLVERQPDRIEAMYRSGASILGTGAWLTCVGIVLAVASLALLSFLPVTVIVYGIPVTGIAMMAYGASEKRRARRLQKHLPR